MIPNQCANHARVSDRYLAKADPHNPLASPVFGDYHGIPPLLIQVAAEAETAFRVAKKARSDGISVKFEVWPEWSMCFQIQGLPESREAIEQIAEFIAIGIA